MHQLVSPTVGSGLAALGVRNRRDLDADRLLAFVLECTHASLRAYPERPLSADDWARWRELLARRKAGEPFAYLVGEQEFWSLPLLVGPGVLIPRADSETLVDAALARLPRELTGWISDVGTGSGNLALALAHERPGLQVVAIELSAEAMHWADQNVSRHGNERVHLVTGRDLDAVASSTMHAVISNPPYIADDDADLDASTECEPRSALFAADSGFAMLRTLAEDSQRVLRPGGWLMLEHGWKQGGQALQCLNALGYQVCETLNDLDGRPRVSVGHWPG